LILSRGVYRQADLQIAYFATFFLLGITVLLAVTAYDSTPVDDVAFGTNNVGI